MRLPVRAVSSLKEEAPLRTKLFFLAFALVVLLPITQTSSAGRLPNRATAYVVIADAGPGMASNMRTAPRRAGQKSATNATRSSSTDYSLVGMMALARTFLMWMGL